MRVVLRLEKKVDSALGLVLAGEENHEQFIIIGAMALPDLYCVCTSMHFTFSLQWFVLTILLDFNTHFSILILEAVREKSVSKPSFPNKLRTLFCSYFSQIATPFPMLVLSFL